MEQNNAIIAQAYKDYSRRVCAYIRRRIKNYDEAQDIMQDVFLRLLDCQVICQATVQNLIFTIANNLVIDRLRRLYKGQQVQADTYYTDSLKTVVRPDQELDAKDLAQMELSLVARLSPATARVYQMTRFQELSIDEIAESLSLSRRTVECHQFKSRKFVREQLRMAL